MQSGFNESDAQNNETIKIEYVRILLVHLSNITKIKVKAVELFTSQSCINQLRETKVYI